jgi:polyribonucleotide nucleotidyltransferase
MIDPEKIRDVIGPGGKVIRASRRRPRQDQRRGHREVYICGPNQDKVDEAASIIRDLRRIWKPRDLLWNRHADAGVRRVR